MALSKIEFNVSGGIAPYNVTLTKGTTFSESQTINSDGQVIFTNLESGSYVITSTANNGECIATRNVTITAAPTTTESTTTSTAAPTTFDLNITDATLGTVDFTLIDGVAGYDVEVFIDEVGFTIGGFESIISSSQLVGNESFPTAGAKTIDIDGFLRQVNSSYQIRVSGVDTAGDIASDTIALPRPSPPSSTSAPTSTDAPDGVCISQSDIDAAGYFAGSTGVGDSILVEFNPNLQDVQDFNMNSVTGGILFSSVNDPNSITNIVPDNIEKSLLIYFENPLVVHIVYQFSLDKTVVGCSPILSLTFNQNESITF